MDNKISQFFILHLRAFLFALGEIIRTPLASLLTIIVIGVAMFLPTALYVSLQNFSSLSQHWDGTPHISLYLKPGLAALESNSLLQELRGNKKIKTIEYISPQQGLSEFEKATGLSDALNDLKQNPLPGVIVITPQEAYQAPAGLESLIKSLKNIPNIDNAQFDLTWTKRLYYLIQIAQRITYALAVLFGFGVILIIGNTIRLITQNNRQEIAVLRLLGATASFIQRPLLYRGIIYGFLGGIIACVFVKLLLLWLSGPLEFLAESYQTQLNLLGFSLVNALSILAICSLLGLIGSWISVHKHLQAPESL